MRKSTCRNISSLYRSEVLTLEANDDQTEAEVEASKNEKTNPPQGEIDENGIWMIGKIKWVPDSAPQWKRKVFFKAHCSNSGHGGKDTTTRIVIED